MSTSANASKGALEKLHAETGWDFVITLKAGAHTAWSAELRMNCDPNLKGTSDRSLVTFAAGGFTPDAALAQAYRDMREWLNKLDPPAASQDCWDCDRD